MRKNKMLLEFNDAQSSAIKQIAVKTNTNIKCTTRFMSGKLLMFAKLSLKSFIYSLAELLSFPGENKTVENIYWKNEIERIFCYHILTDTDSTSLNFLILNIFFAYQLHIYFLKVKFVIFYLKSVPVLKLEKDLTNQIRFGNISVFINLKIKTFLVCMK